MTCCDYCYSLDDGPLVFINECFFSPVFTSHIMMCRGLLVPLTGGEVYVLDPLVLKLLDLSEFGSLPECHAHFVHCGQVRAQRRPVEVSFSPALRTREREVKKRGGGGGGGKNKGA